MSGGSALLRTLVHRGGCRESEHLAAAAVHPRQGTPFSFGAPDQSLFLRSLAKPFQSLALLAAGVDRTCSLSAEELAVISASHAGEEYHHRLVAGLLERNGLAASDLRCGTHEPFSRNERQRRLRAGEEFSPLGNNCSGKHAGMLLHARSLGVDLESYLAPEHPAQVAVRRLLEMFLGVTLDLARAGIDGCGSPTWSVPLSSVARGFARLGDERFLAELRLAAEAARLGAAIDAHPRAYSGEGRLPFQIRPFLGGRLRAKEGAEGGFALWGAEGAVVLKCLDGSDRGLRWVQPEILAGLGWIGRAEREAWQAADPPLVRNVAGHVVGRIAVEVPAFR